MDPTRQLQRLLGLALRSRRVALGRAACRQAAAQGALHVLVVARDAGASALRDSGVSGSVPRIRCELGKRDLGRLAGRAEVALLGVTDPQLAAGVLRAVAPPAGAPPD